MNIADIVLFLGINLGSLSLIATPYMEKDIGFWSAYLLCLCVFMVGTLTLVLGRKLYIVRPPQGSIITDAFRVVWMMIKNRNMDAAKPSYQAGLGKQVSLKWDDHFVEEVKRALVGCKVFAFYPIYWVTYGQFSGNFVSQAGQMRGHGIPNDLMQNFDPIAIIVFLPIMDSFVFPALRKAKIPYPPINRIATGFWVASLAMAYAAIVQHFIYKAGPCYEHPLCDADIDSNGGVSHPTSSTTRRVKTDLAIEHPRCGTNWCLHAHRYLRNLRLSHRVSATFYKLQEYTILTPHPSLEYAYTKAPPSMKSFVQSLYLLTNAFGSAIGEALTPALYDPAIQWVFVGLAVAAFVTGWIVYFTFRHLNALEDDMNALESDVTDDPGVRSGSLIPSRKGEKA
jgi:POT family proton-dependent oligopeptide transporter